VRARAAATVRVRDGHKFVTDGPFAETKEQLGGYFLVDADSRDEAIAIAARIPMARKGMVEVRPVVEIAGLPSLRACSRWPEFGVNERAGSGTSAGLPVTSRR
jgi:hypothetical protein